MELTFRHRVGSPSCRVSFARARACCFAACKNRADASAGTSHRTSPSTPEAAGDLKGLKASARMEIRAAIETCLRHERATAASSDFAGLSDLDWSTCVGP